MIKLKSISKSYFIDSQEIKVLKDINLTIKDGESIAIVGASGSGKSTLMYLIGLLDVPTEGEIYYDQQAVASLSDDQLSRLRNRYVGFVFQQFNLIDRLTVQENILLPVKYSQGKLDFQPEQRAKELMQRLGIAHRLDYYPNKLSGGEQQRTAIARALIMQPKLLLADEPTGNLDSKTGKQIMQVLHQLNQDLGVTLVMVTHDPKLAKQMGRQISIKDGQIHD